MHQCIALLFWYMSIFSWNIEVYAFVVADGFKRKKVVIVSVVQAIWRCSFIFWYELFFEMCFCLVVIVLFVSIISSLNPFLANIPVLYYLKTTENLWLSGVFRRYKMRTLARNWLTYFVPICGALRDLVPFVQF